MRRFTTVVLFALAAGLPGGTALAASTSANISHGRNAYTFQPATYHGQTAGHRHANSAHAIYPAGDKASAHHSRSHHARLTPETRTVTATIAPQPLINMHLAPLVGSRESLVRQNERTEADGLTRIEDEAQLNQLRREKALVPLPVSASLHVNESLPMNRRYTRTWTAKFLTDLARAHYARFRRAVQVNSAVRTVEYQRHLIEVNGNAAPAEGDIASPHLSGASIDIAKKGLSTSEIAWMRGYLYPLQMAGKLDVEEEFYQSCFHITVYKAYAPPATTPKAPARRSATLLAAGVR
ncbi:MAG: hypothetical protein JO300_13035 [Silvibacterium sp.]|nr:hypothetical protein [Silvibacterium sp.]MBV8438179.1 hypothetical protein [Silvibacterium sp.]